MKTGIRIASMILAVSMVALIIDQGLTIRNLNNALAASRAEQVEAIRQSTDMCVKSIEQTTDHCVKAIQRLRH